MTTTRLENAMLLTLEPGAEMIEPGVVVTEGSRIAYAGPAAGAPETPGATVVDCAGCAVLPGLVNAHTHVSMTLLRGFADDMPLQPWLEEKIWPTEMKLTGEDVYWGALLGICEMLRGGVTCFNDMYHYYRDATRAAVDGGIRACPSGVLLGFLPNAPEMLHQARDFVAETLAAGHPRIHPMFGPHAPYTCPDPLLEQVAGYAEELGVPIHIHVSETSGEVQDSLAQYGQTPVERLEKIGLFRGRVAAAHCVHLTDHDIEILAENRVGVCHCPGSNLKLASGFAPVSRLLSAGAVLGLGTDGCASNNNLDLFQEILLVGILDKAVTGDPTVVPAETALALATRESARALGLEDLIGTLTPGKRADLAVVDLSKPHLQPLYHLCSQLVYAARADDVKLTMVEGEIVYREGKLTKIDEEEVIARAQEAAARLTA
jgi:5-methylthioadenosine/S-adenosylhomocysteine deaminase